MTWQQAVCLDPLTVALGGIGDGNVRLADRVAASGLGAIGLMAVPAARLAGASFVAAIDPLPRRAVAAEAPNGLAADLVLDPTAVDAGLEIRRATGGSGVDVSIETSGSAAALHQAIRALAFGGTAAITACYNECRGGLDLGREAHFNHSGSIVLLGRKRGGSPFPLSPFCTLQRGKPWPSASFSIPTSAPTSTTAWRSH